MQPPANNIVVAHAPADASLASYYAIALRTQGAGAAPYSPPAGQSPQAIAAQVRDSRALVVLVTDPAPAWAGALISGYRGLMATERWRRIAIVRRGAGQLSSEMQGLPWIEASDKPVEEVATEILALLAGAPAPAPVPVPAREAQPLERPIPSGPPRWPGAQPIKPSPGDELMTRRALLIGGLGVAAIGAVALSTSAVMTHGFGLFGGAAGASTPPPLTPQVFTSSGNTLYAVDLAKGTLRWGFTADAFVRPAESASKEVIYAISEQGTVYALSVRDGKPIWHASIPGPVKVRPVESGGLIYTGSDDNNVYALNTKDGSVIWKFTTNGPVEARPTIANGVVYIGSQDTMVYALGASDGKQIWKYNTNGPIASSAAVGGDVIYIGSDDRNLRAIRIADGRLHWRFQTGRSISSSPAVAGDTVYVGSQDGGLYAIQTDAPKMRWRFRTGDAVFSSPVVDNGVVYFGSSDHTVYAVGTDGKKIWNYKTGGAVNGRLLFANGVVYANSDALYALDAAKGAPIWHFAADGKSGYFSPGLSS